MTDKFYEAAKAGVKLMIEDENKDDLINFLTSVALGMSTMQNEINLLKQLSDEKDLPKKESEEKRPKGRRVGVRMV